MYLIFCGNYSYNFQDFVARSTEFHQWKAISRLLAQTFLHLVRILNAFQVMHFPLVFLIIPSPLYFKVKYFILVIHVWLLFCP